jgi:hypothetical protein
MGQFCHGLLRMGRFLPPILPKLTFRKAKAGLKSPKTGKKTGGDEDKNSRERCFPLIISNLRKRLKIGVFRASGQLF